MRRTTLWILASALGALTFACPEAKEDEQTTSSSSGTGGNTSTSSSSSSGTTSTGTGGGGGSSTSSGSGGASIDGLVINEIDASDEWVELYNAGASTVDLGGLKIADYDDATQGPKVDEAMQFPSGTTLAAGEYLFVIGDITDPQPGPQTANCDPGPTPCYHVAWKISGSGGDTIYILDEADVGALHQEYPPDAVADGQTYGRLPNGTGSFAACAPTPGAENAAP